MRKALLGIVLGAATISAVQADRPQPVVIQATIVFNPLAEGTFTSTSPLCASGTIRTLRFIANPSLLHGHGFTSSAEFVCDDNSGSFEIQLHPQAGSNYAGGTRDPEFTVSGPWSIVGGTGRYTNLSGHGDFGAVVDFDRDPWTGTESYVGFVKLR
jgi:hypothetical protein